MDLICDLKYKTIYPFLSAENKVGKPFERENGGGGGGGSGTAANPRRCRTLENANLRSGRRGLRVMPASASIGRGRLRQPARKVSASGSVRVQGLA